MNRLPTYDFSANRLERAAFLVLNLVAFALVGMALRDGARFAAGRERSTPAVVQAMKPAVQPAGNALTQIAPWRVVSDVQTAGARRLPAPKS